jgi:hypothetical protein
MSDDIKKITIQIRRPRSKDMGEVAIATTASSRVSFILTDEADVPPGADKRYIGPAGDAHLIACRMVRNNRKSRASVRGFNRPLNYPKLVY